MGNCLFYKLFVWITEEVSNVILFVAQGGGDKGLELT